MALRTIIVFIEPSSAGNLRVEYAIKLASSHKAHLIAVFIVPHAWDKSPADGYIRHPDAVSGMLARYEQAEQDAVYSAEQIFNKLAQGADCTTEFRAIVDSNSADLARLNCFYSDLVISGHPAPGGLPLSWPPERMLFATGIPFIIVPQDWHCEQVPNNVLLAWNASRESRRAISDALPLLINARSVAVVIVDPKNNPSHGEEPGADIARFLSRHGVAARVEPMISDGKSVANTIQDFSARDGSDLIVLGAYSHSQTREMIFGGVTRSLLHSVTVPTLIAH